MVRPQSGEDKSDLLRGDGKIIPEYDYLKYADPMAYQWHKLKDEGNIYADAIDEKIWAEAARRGEKEALVDLIMQNTKNDENIKSKATVTGEEDWSQSARSAAHRVSSFGEFADYDAYMLALQLPFMDNKPENRKPRVDEETNYYWGDYTDREWAEMILENDYQRMRGAVIEEKKKTQNFFVSLGTSLADIGVRLAGDITSFISDIYNVQQGLLNLMLDWSEKDLGTRFLKAFDNNDILEQVTKELEEVSYQLERDFGFVIDARTGEVTSAGKYWQGTISAIGYMLPTIGTGKLLSLGIKGAKAGVKSAKVVKQTKQIGSFTSKVFYAGIASGSIKNSVEYAMNNGISLDQLNAGAITGNAVIKSIFQYMIEKLTGGVLGSSTLDRLIGTSVKASARVGQITSKVAEKAGVAAKVGKTGLSAFGKYNARLSKDAMKEGIEETLQELSDGLFDATFGGLGEITAAGMKDEHFSLETLADSFLIGAMTSIVLGFAADMKYIPKKNRAIGVNADGKYYTMGAFQSMNLARALQTMNDWNAVLNDPDASEQEKMDAATRISFFMSTVGDIMSSMGQDKILKTNATLMKSLDGEAKKKTLVKLSNVNYAKKLIKEFNKKYEENTEGYLKQELEKIQKALEKNADKLKKAGVTEIDDIVTVKKKSDDPTIEDKVDELIKATKAQAVCLSDGSIAIKSDDVIITNKEYLAERPIQDLLQQLGYEAIEEKVTSALTKNQRNMVLKVFRDATGDYKAELGDAVKAIMFDKHFYTRVLLVAGENNKMSKESFAIFAVLDQVIQKEAAIQRANKTLSDDAQKVLLERARENMRAAIINYATQCAFINVDMKINLDGVSREVLDPETKKIIREHPNYLFTEQFNEDLKAVQNISKNIPIDTIDAIDEKRLNRAKSISVKDAHRRIRERYLQWIRAREDIVKDYANLFFSESGNKLTSIGDKRVYVFGKNQDGYNSLLTLLRSENPKHLEEAMLCIRLISRRLGEDEDIDEKTLILYTPREAFDNLTLGFINVLEERFGNTLEELRNGTYDINKIPEETKNDIVARNTEYGFEFAIYSQRLKYCREYLFEISGNSLTLNDNFEVCKILDAYDVFDDKFMNELEPSLELWNYVKKKKGTLTIKELLKDSLKDNRDIANVKLRVLKGDGKELRGGNYNISTNVITIYDNNDMDYFLMSLLLHELTHAVQSNALKRTKKNIMVMGGSGELFTDFDEKEYKRLIQDLRDTYPVLSRALTKFPINKDEKYMLYTLLFGENEAMATISTSLVQTGYKIVVDQKKNIVGVQSPSGKVFMMKPEPMKKEKEPTVETKDIPVDKAKDVSVDKETERKFNELTEDNQAQIDNLVAYNRPLDVNETKCLRKLLPKLNIRRATPKEEFRLMGIKDNDFERIQTGLQDFYDRKDVDKRLYHLAGDSIVTNVLVHLFDSMYKQNIITKPLRLIEFFAGYGSQSFALDYLNKDYESWRICEWAVPSIIAYNAAHNKDTFDYAKGKSTDELRQEIYKYGVSFNYNNPAKFDTIVRELNNKQLKMLYNAIKATKNFVDISKTKASDLAIDNTDKFDYMMFYSFPCQDISAMGKGKGIVHEKALINDALRAQEKTRSGLLYEVGRILEECEPDKRPKILVLENSPLLLSDKHIKSYEKWQDDLSKLGYKSFGKILTASDYGIPQSRRREFLVSILNYEGDYKFPNEIELTETYQDLQEKKVDEKYYVKSETNLNQFMNYSEKYPSFNSVPIINKTIASTLLTTQIKRATGGNFISDKVDTDINLYTLLHPETDEQVKALDNAIEKVEKGGKISLSDISPKNEPINIDDASTRRKKAKARTRLLRKRRAMKSNLKYFYIDGIVNLVDNDIQDFVEATTKDFDKLPNWLKIRIKDGSLDVIDLKHYAATANDMNDYTFKAIAKYFFKNDALAQLTKKEYELLRDKYLTPASEIVLKSKKIGIEQDELGEERTLEEMKKYVDKIYSKYKNELSLKYTDDGVKRKEQKPFDILYTQLPFFKFYDGTLRSLYRINQYTLGIDENSSNFGYNAKRADVNYETNDIDADFDNMTTRTLEEKVKDFYRNKYLNKFAKDSKNLEDTYDRLLSTQAGRLEAARIIYELENIDENGPFETIEYSEDGNVTGKNEATYDKRRWNSLSTKEKSSYIPSKTWSELSTGEKISFIRYFEDAYANSRVNKITANIDKQLQEYRQRLEEEYLRQETSIITDKPIEQISTVKRNSRPNAVTKEKIYNVGNRMLNRIVSKSRYDTLSPLTKKYIVYKDGEYVLDNSFVNNYDGSLQEIYETLLDDEYILKSTMTSSQKIRAEKERIVRVLKNQNKQLDEAIKSLNEERIKQLQKYIEENNKKLQRIEERLDKATIKEQQEKLKLAEKLMKEKARVEKEKAETEKQKKRAEKAKEEKQTFKEKADPDIETFVRGEHYKFESNQEPNDIIKRLIKTEFSGEYMTNVRDRDSNLEVEKMKAKEFYQQNNFLMNASIEDIATAAEWFMNADLQKIGEVDPIQWAREQRHFELIRGIFLTLAVDYAQPGGIWSELSPNLVKTIDTFVTTKTSLGSEFLNMQKESLRRKEPIKWMLAKNIVMDGIEIPTELQEKLTEALSGKVMTPEKIKDLKEVQQKIVEYIDTNRTGNKSLVRRITAFRAMSMLSSPLTWLRNIFSNFMLKRLNNVSEKLGNFLFGNKDYMAGQIKMTGNVNITFDKKTGKPVFKKGVTPEIQEYINKNFFENGLFDTLVNKMSKFSPTDIKDFARNDITGKPTTEGILGTLVLKNLYNEYYNREVFKTKSVQKFFEFVMNRMNDTPWIRENTIKYFAKLLAEHEYDLKNTEGLTDNIANDFAIALSLALRDYMHNDNVFNKIEKALAESDLGQGWWFAYKTFLPFASATWNWLKAAWRYSPLGLARAIVNSARLENRVRKIEAAVESGKSNYIPEATEYLTRRDLGSGVLGTMLMAFGALLAWLGKIRLEEDDYGVPKLKIGNIVVDVSAIFGSSSMLYGAAIVEMINKNGKFDDIMNTFGGLVVEGFPIMSIVEFDMHGSGVFNAGLDNLQSIVLSFIPNMSAYIARAVQVGQPKYQGNYAEKFLQKAVAKIPFLNWTLPATGYTKTDIYTGKQKEVGDNALDTILKYNIWRAIPYVSLDLASQNEKKTTALGLNKSMLRGEYVINDKEVKVTGSLLTELNKNYGEWNADDLTKFYQNKMKVKVKTKNGYKELSYNQMSADERKRAVNTIMSNNAEIAKIKAWTTKGNKYYASADMYNTLKSRGIKSNVYRGTNGFVEKK